MMKVLYSKVYLFIEGVMSAFSEKLKWKRNQRKKIVNELVEDYQEMIIEFGLIQEGKSKLSAKKRKEVTDTIYFLIERGHIKVN